MGEVLRLFLTLSPPLGILSAPPPLLPFGRPSRLLAGVELGMGVGSGGFSVWVGSSLRRELVALPFSLLPSSSSAAVDSSGSGFGPGGFSLARAGNAEKALVAGRETGRTHGGWRAKPSEIEG